VLLGPAGIEKVMKFGSISMFEQATLDAMIPDLVSQAKKGVEYVKGA
jgi:malate dehydrogenase